MAVIKVKIGICCHRASRGREGHTSFIFLEGLGIEPEALCMLGRYSTVNYIPSPFHVFVLRRGLVKLPKHLKFISLLPQPPKFLGLQTYDNTSSTEVILAVLHFCTMNSLSP